MNPAKKKPRSSRRYAYSCQAQATVGNELDEAKITNISASGIQFETQNPIRLKAQIKLLWNDPTFGIMSANMYVVREVVDAERAEFKYIYGAQYAKLDQELKNRLIQLLKTQHEKEAQDALEKIQEASPEYLLDVANQAEKYLLQFLTKEQATLPAVLKAINSLAEYEMKSFLKSNDYSNLIQKFSALTFQYHLLIYLVAVVLERQDDQRKYLQIVAGAVKKFGEIENQVDIVSAKIKKLEGPDKQKEGLVGRIFESMNRSFYAKQDLIQIVREAFDSEALVTEYSDSLQSITEEYEHSLEISKRSFFDISGWDAMKKIYRLNDYEVIIDNRPPPGTIMISNFTSIVVVITWIAIVILLFRK